SADPAVFSVSFDAAQVTFFQTGVTASALLGVHLSSGLPGAQLSVQPAFAGADYVGTGATVTVAWTEGDIPRSRVYGVVLYGDVNGDGLVNTQDPVDQSGLFTYSVTDGQATIIDVDEQSAQGEMVIPESLGGYPVTSIGARAFKFCGSITRLVIGDHITSAGTEAFSPMDGLRSVVIGSGLQTLPEGAFFMDGTLQSVSLSAGLRSIGTDAFGACVSLRAVSLPYTVEHIGDSAFAGCRTLSTVQLGERLTTIGNNAFDRCSSLGEIEIPPNVTSLGRNAFANCPYVLIVCGYNSAAHQYALANSLRFRLALVLVELRIAQPPNKLIYYSNEGFNAQGLELRAVYDDNSEEILSQGAQGYSISGFETNQPGEKTVLLHYKYKSVSFTVRVYEFQFTYLSGGAQVMATRYVGNSQEARVPESIEGKPVVYLGATAFSGRTDVTKIVLPATVQSVQPGAFDGASALQDFEAAEGGSFQCRDGILYDAAGGKLIAYPAGRQQTEFALPAQVTVVAPHAFSGCGALEKIFAGLGQTIWQSYAVIACPNLTLQVYEFTPAHSYAQGEAVPYQFVSTAATLGLTPPNKLDYIVREALDSTGMALWLTYEDGAEFQLLAGYALAGFDSATAGQKTVTVSFQRFSQSFVVTVAETNNRVYRYETLGDGTIKLTYYLGAGGDLTVPSEIDGRVVSAIGDSLYEGLSAVRSVNIPPCVRSVGNRAMANCTALTQVTFSEGLQSLGNEVFSRCLLLDNIVLPQSLQSIGSFCFTECLSLRTLALPDAVTHLGNYVFNNCAALQTLSIGSGLAELGIYPFNGCAALQSVAVSGDNASFTQEDGVLFNKSATALLRYPQGRGESSYTIPAQVRSVGLGAFSGATGLREIYLPRSVESIASSAFSGCAPTLVIFCYRNSPAHIFAAGSGISYQLLPDPAPISMSILSLPDQLHYYVGDSLVLTGLALRLHYDDWTEDVISGYSVSGFDSSQAGSCTVTVSCKGVSAPFTVTIDPIATAADFEYDITGSDTVSIRKYIGDNATVRIPAAASVAGSQKRITGIGAEAFKNCTFITEVVIPPAVLSIGTGAFRNCTALEEVVLPPTLAALPDYLFEGCSALLRLELPAGLQTIGGYVFSGCAGLKYLPLPESLQIISGAAFYNMPSLKHLTIPANVSSIGALAFGYCPNLLTVFFLPQAASLGGNVLDHSPNACPMAAQGSAVLQALQAQGLLAAGYAQSGDWYYGNWSGGSGVNILAYLGDGVRPQLPASLGGAQITGIAAHAFFNRRLLAAAVLPEGYSSIGAGAFALCAALEQITVPSQAVGYGDAEVFFGCGSALTLEGLRNSTTQHYATQRGLPFLQMEQPSFVYAGGVSPLRTEGETAEGYQLVSGFTPVYATPAQLRALFVLEEGQTLYFQCADYNEAPENAPISTGTEIQLWDSEDGLVDILVAVVFGDVSMDGLTDGRDASRISAIIAGLLTPQSMHQAAYLAADANRDGAVDATDFNWLRECGLGKRTISQSPAW
ncbi:MAG: leucine-rich repeat protein, partial [Oscillospiraceae bacterium]|nr:leucine-rich repeat protein [Oscillospiraceae bacterium]